jgi:hypothetical protein
MKRCCTCSKFKSLDEFGKNKNEPDGKQKYCKVCRQLADKKCYSTNPNRRRGVRKSTDEMRKRNREFILEYLSTHPCVDCGENDPIVLDFDHVRNKKFKNVGILCLNGFSVDKIKEEIDKCDVRCANCHRRKTAKQFGWYKLIGDKI